MEIKQLVIAELKNIKKQAAELGLCAIELTSGSMEKRLGLNARTPAVCNALRDAIETCDDETKRDSVKKDSTTNVFRFNIRKYQREV